MQFSGLVLFAITLLPLVLLQRLLHREVQAVVLIITRSPQLAFGLFSILFFPGVILHELSHFIMAKLLGVRTGGLSLSARLQPDGRAQLGYVETERTDLLRDSLIGLAPLISGSLFIAYAGLYRLQIGTLLQVLFNAQWNLFWLGLSYLPHTNDFALWAYLVFTVSSTMLPSESDRRAWRPLLLWVSALLGLAFLAGAGPWMIAQLAPPLSGFLGAIATLFGLSDALHIVALLFFFGLHRVLAAITNLDVA